MSRTTGKILTAAAAGILGVALVGGAAYAASGSLVAADAPGQVLQVSGVGPAADNASDTAKTHANPNAKGLFGTDASATEGAQAGVDAEAQAAANQKAQADAAAQASAAAQGASSTNTATPVPPTEAAQDAATVKGSATGESISAWAHLQPEVETVTPAPAVSVDVDAAAKARD